MSTEPRNTQRTKPPKTHEKSKKYIAEPEMSSPQRHQKKKESQQHPTHLAQKDVQMKTLTMLEELSPATKNHHNGIATKLSK